MARQTREGFNNEHFDGMRRRMQHLDPDYLN
jgi:hypothetical protein